MRRQIDHVLRHPGARNVVEVVVFVPEFVLIAQRGAQQALAEGLQRDDVLPV